jgi:hypothetical protein
MATIAGYTIFFLVDNLVKQITIADPDDRAIENKLAARYGRIQILSRTSLDATALELLGLKHGQWVEWAPLARGRS